MNVALSVLVSSEIWQPLRHGELVNMLQLLLLLSIFAAKGLECLRPAALHRVTMVSDWTY